MFFILGLIVATGTSTIAYNINAKQIGYTPSDNTWNVDTVEKAINSLKENTHSSYSLNTTAVSCGTSESSNTCTINTFEIDEYYICQTGQRSTDYVTISDSEGVIFHKIIGSYLNGLGSDMFIIKPTTTSVTFTSPTRGMAVDCYKFN